MRKASLPKIDRGEITSGMTAAPWFVQVWSQLRDLVEPVARDALRDGDDGQLHNLTLTPSASDTLTDYEISGAKQPTTPPTTPTPPPVWGFTYKGDGYAQTYNAQTAYKVNGQQVVKARQTLAAPTYAAPSGGSTVDTEGRAALAKAAADLAALRAAIQAHGLTT